MDCLSFPEDGLFHSDIVASGFVVGDGVVGFVAATPSLPTVFAIAGDGEDACCFGGLSHSTE